MNSVGKRRAYDANSALEESPSDDEVAEEKVDPETERRMNEMRQARLVNHVAVNLGRGSRTRAPSRVIREGGGINSRRS